MSVRVIHGDMREELAKLAAEGVRVQAIVTDPPYHLTSIVKRFSRATSDDVYRNAELRKTFNQGVSPYARAARGFMGKVWDGGDIAFQPETWRLCYNLLPPGGHLLAFGGTRTYHRLVCAIEDAGFEIRDSIGWLFGSGFPKSHDVSKGIDKRGGAGSLLTAEIGEALRKAREARGLSAGECDRIFCGGSTNWSWFEGRAAGQRAPMPETFSRIVAEWPELAHLADAVAEAERESIGVKRAGIATPGDVERHTVGGSRSIEVDITAPATAAARQWQGWGTALKPAMELICLARKPLQGTIAANVLAHGTGAINVDACRVGTDAGWSYPNGRGGSGWHGQDSLATNLSQPMQATAGRWPANVAHDGSDEVLRAFPESGGQSGAVTGQEPSTNDRYILSGLRGNHETREPRGDFGSAARFFFTARPDDVKRFHYTSKADAGDRLESRHPTIKPVDLMRWLVRLVTPPGGTVLDPFAGSGTTGMACLAEGFDCILVEREAEYAADIRRRIAHVHGEDTPLFQREAV